MPGPLLSTSFEAQLLRLEKAVLTSEGLKGPSVLKGGASRRATSFHLDSASLKGSASPRGGSPSGHARLGLGFGLFLGYRAAGDGDDAVLDGGDLTPHAGPDADGEALVDGLSYLLLVLHLDRPRRRAAWPA